MVNKINAAFWPSRAQFKYIGRFLNPAERKIIRASIFLIVLSVVVLGVSFFMANAVAVPAEGGAYSEALVGQPKLVNPLFTAASDVDADLAYLIYSGLFKIEGQKPIPDLAKSYTVSKDGLKYDIALRDDAQWSDGEPFTASDVLYTFEMITDPEVDSPLLPSFAGAGVEQIDDYTVRFTLKEPYAPFLSALAAGILPQHYWSDIQPASLKLARNNLQPIGTGPWQFSKLTKDEIGNIQTYSLSRNENYYGQKPYLKNLVFKFYADQIQALGALKSQEADALAFIPKSAKDKVPGKVYNFYSFKLPQYTALFLNQEQNGALTDNDLREALDLAIDKDALLREALGGAAEPASSPFLPGTTGYNSEIKYPAWSRDEANKKLDKKWKRIQPEQYFKTQYEKALKDRQEEIDRIKNSTSTPDATSTIKLIEEEAASAIREEMQADQPYYRKDKDDNILALVITTADTPEYKEAGEFVARMWRAVGAQTSVRLASSLELTKDILKTRDYQILLYGEIVGSDPDPYPFWHSSQTSYPGLNLALFADRNADKILEEARGKAEPEKRVELYKKFQEILFKEKPAIFLYAPTYELAANKNIRGISLNQISNPPERFADLKNWYVKMKRKWKFGK